MKVRFCVKDNGSSEGAEGMSSLPVPVQRGEMTVALSLYVTVYVCRWSFLIDNIAK